MDNKKYEEKDSPRYKLKSKRRLIELLHTSEKKLKELKNETDLYEEWKVKKKSGTERIIESPRDDLKRLQSRISGLLQRISPPDFLFSPVKGRSYVENAERHKHSTVFHALDIEDFFPSCTSSRVAWFFGTRLQCSPDVTAILVGLTTRNGHLPQGSPCSPILAYYAYVDMWEEIDKLVRQAGCTLSIYADDITISGHKIPGHLIWNVKRIIRRYGHNYKKEKEFGLINKPMETTGVILSRGRLLLPNRQHKKRHELKKEMATAKSSNKKKRLSQQLAGRESQARQILDKNKPESS